MQVDSRSSELKSFCRLHKVECSVCCSRWPAVPANGTLLRRDACRALPAIPILGGESGFSPHTVRPTPLARTATPASHGSHRLELSADGALGSSAVPVTGGLGRGNRSGFHRRGCRLHRKPSHARNRAGLLLIFQSVAPGAAWFERCTPAARIPRSSILISAGAKARPRLPTGTASSPAPAGSRRSAARCGRPEGGSSRAPSAR